MEHMQVLVLVYYGELSTNIHLRWLGLGVKRLVRDCRCTVYQLQLTSVHVFIYQHDSTKRRREMQTTGKKVITRLLGLTYAPCTCTLTLSGIIDNFKLLINLLLPLLCYASGPNT